MTNKIIQNKVTGTNVKPLEAFMDFQGDLKKLGKEQLSKLKKNIIKNGFVAPVFVWKGHESILDGHQRLIALKSLLKDGYEFANVTPDGQVIVDKERHIPFVEIEAVDESQAAELVLSYNSQFGRVQQQGFIDFAGRYNLDLPDIRDRLELEVDFPKLDVSNDFGFQKDGVQKDGAEEVNELGKHVITCPHCGHQFKKGKQ